MRPRASAPTLILLAALAAASCTGVSKPKPRASASAIVVPRGGTLRVGIFLWNPDGPIDPTTGFGEPQGGWVCCMYRTLYSFSGRPTDQGGSVIQPDLATAAPEVSPDGMVWTFHMRAGLHYAPPLQNVEITASDIVRAIERMLTPAPKAVQDATGPLLGDGAAGYFASAIQGATDYSSGKADSISGLETPDPHTLRVRLTQAIGDLDYRFSLYSTSPIPPNPFRPETRLGVADGHEENGYERVLVSSGPYMFEGSEKIDFSRPPDQQQPSSGYETLTLVRNPSWRPGSDHLRAAYPDRIEFVIHDNKAHSIGEVLAPNVEDFLAYAADSAKRVEAGEIDTVIDAFTPLDVVARYRADPNLQQRLQVIDAGVIRFLALNVALPPFDDMHVRRAINFVIDKQAVLDAWQRFRPGGIYDHLAPDKQENNLLVDYHPYPSPEHRGDPAAAQREMALSAYDRNHDGQCDQPACTVSVLWRNTPGYPEIAKIVKRNLAKIGIILKTNIVDAFEMYSTCSDPAKHATLCQNGWGGDYPSATTYFPPLYSSDSLGGGFNFSLTGATPEQLSQWRYSVRSVPDLDSRMNDCSTKVGADQVQCWAAFDQYMMEQVVPAVPLLTDTAPWIFSARVAHFSWSAVYGTPALDQIALKPGS